MSLFCEGPNFFASGRIFLLIWPNIFVRIWQQWIQIDQRSSLSHTPHTDPETDPEIVSELDREKDPETDSELDPDS
jgi:hypothetical protein